MKVKRKIQKNTKTTAESQARYQIGIVSKIGRRKKIGRVSLIGRRKKMIR